MEYFGYQKLDVYRASIRYVSLVGKIIEQLPSGKAYLSNQLQRAATSITLNIAEGAGEYSRKEKAHFYRIAKRSATECAAVMDVCICLELVDKAICVEGLELLQRIFSMLVKMARRYSNQDTDTDADTDTKTTKRRSHRPWQPPPRRPPSYK